MIWSLIRTIIKNIFHWHTFIDKQLSLEVIYKLLKRDSFISIFVTESNLIIFREAFDINSIHNINQVVLWDIPWLDVRIIKYLLLSNF